MDRDAAEAVATLGDGDVLAELGGLDRGLLAARARADDEEIEVHVRDLPAKPPRGCLAGMRGPGVPAAFAHLRLGGRCRSSSSSSDPPSSPTTRASCGCPSWPGSARRSPRCTGSGVDVVVVTSGAIARGMRLLELPVRPTEIAELQAASAVGQGRLYRTYDELLRELGLQTRAGAAHLLRHERAEPLPERAAHAADAAGLADRPRHQRERHDDDGRDLLRRQRLPRGPGRGARRRAAARAADRHRRPLHRRSAHRPGRRARRGGPPSGGARASCRSATRSRRSARAGCAPRSWPPRWRPPRESRP